MMSPMVLLPSHFLMAEVNVQVQVAPVAVKAAASSEDEADEHQARAAASVSPTSAFSYSHAGLPGSGHGSSSFEHAGHDDDASSNASSWEQASSLARADSGKPRSEPDSEEALSELQVNHPSCVSCFQAADDRCSLLSKKLLHPCIMKCINIHHWHAKLSDDLTIPALCL